MNFDREYYSVRRHFDYNDNLILNVYEWESEWKYLRRLIIYKGNSPTPIVHPYLAITDDSKLLDRKEMITVYDYYKGYLYTNPVCKICKGKKYIELFTFWVPCDCNKTATKSSYTFEEVSKLLK